MNLGLSAFAPFYNIFFKQAWWEKVQIQFSSSVKFMENSNWEKNGVF